MSKVTSTGVSALDKSLLKGIPRGFTILVTGEPGSGLELFAKQFAGTNQKTENVVYITTTERDEDLLGSMEEFGFATDMRIINIGTQYYETVLAQQLEISRYRQEGISLKDVRLFESRARQGPKVQNFLTLLTYEFSRLKPPFRAVIDSLDFFLEYHPHAEVLSALRTIKARTQHEDSVTLLTMLNRVHDVGTQSGVEEIVDCIIELERVREGAAYKHSIVLRKVRNHPDKTGIYAYEITSTGITPASDS